MARRRERRRLPRLRDCCARTCAPSRSRISTCCSAGPVPLDLDALQTKLVRARRGGYCFEHATLFAAVLEALGLRTGPAHGARRPVHAAHAVAAHAHVPDRSRSRAAFVVDPGFGGLAPQVPVPLVPRRRRAAPSGVRTGWRATAALGAAGAHRAARSSIAGSRRSKRTTSSISRSATTTRRRILRRRSSTGCCCARRTADGYVSRDESQRDDRRRRQRSIERARRPRGTARAAERAFRVRSAGSRCRCACRRSRNGGEPGEMRHDGEGASTTSRRSIAIATCSIRRAFPTARRRSIGPPGRRSAPPRSSRR